MRLWQQWKLLGVVLGWFILFWWDDPLGGFAYLSPQAQLLFWWDDPLGRFSYLSPQAQLCLLGFAPWWVKPGLFKSQKWGKRGWICQILKRRRNNAGKGSEHWGSQRFLLGILFGNGGKGAPHADLQEQGWISRVFFWEIMRELWSPSPKALWCLIVVPWTKSCSDRCQLWLQIDLTWVRPGFVKEKGLCYRKTLINQILFPCLSVKTFWQQQIFAVWLWRVSLWLFFRHSGAQLAVPDPTENLLASCAALYGSLTSVSLQFFQVLVEYQQNMSETEFGTCSERVWEQGYVFMRTSVLLWSGDK